MKHRKLRRIGILVLVLVLLFNTLGARASTGAPDIEVTSYEELIAAIEQASNLDVILIKGVIYIPEGAALGNDGKIITLKSSGGFIEVVDDPEKAETTVIENITFDGGGLSLLAPYLRIAKDTEITGCTFKNCGANGAVNVSYSNAAFRDCTFRDNTGSYGAHICIGYNGSASFTNCLFTGGVSSNRGGAIYLDASTSTAVISDSIITGNSGVYGGGIANWGDVQVTNTLLYGNTATAGGAELFSVGTYKLEDIENMKALYNEAGIEPISWESDYTDLDYGGTCLKLNYEAYVSPVEPEEPSEEEPSQSTEPDEEETDPEPTDPVTPPEETDPSTGEDEETDPPSTGGDEKEDPTTTPSEEDPTETQEPEGTEKPEDEDKPPTTATPSDADEAGGGNTDNSSVDNSDNSTTDNSTVDNSQTNTDNSQSNSSSSSVVDNSSHESNDNSSYREDNSYRDSSSTVNYYYQQESPIQESPTASQNGSQPINITVPVEVSTQQGETASMGSTGAPEGDHITTAPQQNIKIEAEGVDLVYEYTEGGISISISSSEAPESPTEAIAVNSPTPIIETPQEADKSPNWVEFGSVILLAVLVWLEVKDRWKNKA